MPLIVRMNAPTYLRIQTLYYLVVDKTSNTATVPFQTFENTDAHQYEIPTIPPSELEHTEYPSYTPMAALPHKQLQLKPSAYANLSD